MTGAIDEGTPLGGGRYILQSRLGSGGAATVWLADDTVLDRSVAVKVLSEGLASDESWLARFSREARLAASLTHPNLVSVYDFDAGSERPFIVMAHMPGGSLHERIHAGEHPEPERLARDLLGALAAIHATGIIHRDIKPGNVLLDADGTACLTDFGVARPEDATSLTQTGHIPGTGRFMAPELWQGHPADERTDLYAAGILLRGAVGDEASPELRELIESLAAEEAAGRPPSATAALARLPSASVTPVAPLRAGAAAQPEPTPRTIVIRSESHSNRVAAFAGLAALAVVVIVALAQAIGGGDADSGGGSGSGGDQTAQSGTNGGKEGGGDGGSSGSEGSDEVSDVSTAEEAVALDREALALINAGDPKGAIPLLRRAVSHYPEDSADLNYAYALYNLGNALHLSGKSKQAIPILERRLEFNNQTSTVQATLAAAREAAAD